MNTYTVYKNGTPIARKVFRLQVKAITGISDTMLNKCIDSQGTYKSTYTFAIDGEIKAPWEEAFETEWNKVRTAAKLLKTRHGKIMEVDGKKVTVIV